MCVCVCVPQPDQRLFSNSRGTERTVLVSVQRSHHTDPGKTYLRVIFVIHTSVHWLARLGTMSRYYLHLLLTGSFSQCVCVCVCVCVSWFRGAVRFHLGFRVGQRENPPIFDRLPEFRGSPFGHKGRQRVISLLEGLSFAKSQGRATKGSLRGAP